MKSSSKWLAFTSRERAVRLKEEKISVLKENEVLTKRIKVLVIVTIIIGKSTFICQYF
jgi:hypothetical protein